MGQVNIKPASVVAQEKKESERVKLKTERNNALNTLTYEFSDGKQLQVRPQDKANIEIAIASNIEQKWIMKDNTTRIVTVAELQEALDYSIQQAQIIWQQYVDDLEQLMGSS